MYTSAKNNSCIHNLSSVEKIPLVFQTVISLGMKFCLPCKPDVKIIKQSVQETVRKIAWKLYFNENKDNSEDHPLKSWYINNVKDHRKINKITGPICNLQSSLVDTNALCKDIIKSIFKNTQQFTDLFSPTINDFKQFLTSNRLLVVEADKNAGVCIVDKKDYENEVLRQLNDMKSYFPTTNTHFELSMVEFRDKLKIFDKLMPDNFKLCKFLSIENRPANFYILPKIHKPFDLFPKGRPISSTFTKTNKYASKFLDLILKPSLNQVEDLLIDTQHLLLLLNEVKLDKNKKYTLVTVDVEALYPSLNITDCKKHCVDAYLKQENKIHTMSRNSFRDLMSLSLDYNYVMYENQLFYQFRGIEMGNAASVSVANITVFQEIKDIFMGKSEIVFNKRFLDDIIMIVDNENVNDMDSWLHNLLKHRYLKFTYEHSNLSVNFLDVSISLNKENNLCTTIFSKPMSRHLYLHSQSNHPSHLKNSLFYSQGLRVIRICSNKEDSVKNLLCLLEKFKMRGYKVKKLNSTLDTLLKIDRSQALFPKGTLLKNYLAIHNPTVLTKYKETLKESRQPINDNTTYAIFPFYECISNYKDIIVDNITEHMNIHKHDESANSAQHKAHQTQLQVVFKRTHSLKEKLKI